DGAPPRGQRLPGEWVGLWIVFLHGWVSSFLFKGFPVPDAARTVPGGPRGPAGHGGTHTKQTRTKKDRPRILVRKRSERSQAQCGARAGSIARLVVGARALPQRMENVWAGRTKRRPV